MLSLSLFLVLSTPEDMELAVKVALKGLSAKPYARFEDKTGLLRPTQTYEVTPTGRAAILEKLGWSRVEERTWRFGDREIQLYRISDAARPRIEVARVSRLPVHLRNLMMQREKLMLVDLDNSEGFTTLVGEAGINIVLFPAGRSDRLLFITNDLEVGGKTFPMALACYGYQEGKAKRLWAAELAPDKSAPSKGSLDRYLRNLQLYVNSKPHQGWKVVSPPNGANREILAHTGYAASIEHSGDSGVTVGFIHPDGRWQSQSFMDEIEFTLAEEKFLKG